MNRTPDYFDNIRTRAGARWDQLEKDPELAGPWHQLFRQVQSPRHVVSELLQNADDAGATEATVDICDGEFIFSHNGKDFTEEHFASLCRFGYSNKRALHTIGFRGVGFKSTFSLGDEVRLLTPTLAVRFMRERFTEPIWLEAVEEQRVLTSVRVRITDEHRHRELEKNLGEWLRSPASLLFFRHIRRLRISDKEVHWTTQGKGPIMGSTWMSLSSALEKPYLLIQSAQEAFPADALAEIRQERMVRLDEDASFPPCRVEIVLGMQGHLFVILPTGVRTNLPFACNAPFMQDPARVKIKDPDTSPTNRWLLARAGKLAATAMLSWVGDDGQPLPERCRAYSLLSDVNRDDNSLEGSCATIVEKAFEDTIGNEAFLLNESGNLKPWGGCTSVPEELLDIWTPEQVSTLFAGTGETLSRHIGEGHRRTLVHWDCVEELKKADVIRALESKHLPRPGGWRQLMILWAYVADDLSAQWRRLAARKSVKIVPVQGRDVLYHADDVVRLGEKKLLQSDDDWEYLAERLLVMNQNWPRFLAEQRRKAEETEDKVLEGLVEDAYRVLVALGLTESSDVSRVMEQVSDEFFQQGKCNTGDCIRLAHLAAALGATVPNSFQYVTCGGSYSSVRDNVIVDDTGRLATFVPPSWYQKHVLHRSYLEHCESCTAMQWQEWLHSERSRLLTFVPLLETRPQIVSKRELEAELRKRGHSHDLEQPYRSNNYGLKNDWDFDEEHWAHWERLADADPDVWGKLVMMLLEQPARIWQKRLWSQAVQHSKGCNYVKSLEVHVPAAWIVKLRELPCLQDSRGKYRHPAELLRRTPDTESLLDVEPFVRAEMDTETTRELLMALGVRDTPTGPGRLLDRLRNLATTQHPPVYEVEKWYHRIDQLVGRCSTKEVAEIKDAFVKERIILTEDCSWACAAEVFLAADEEDVPGAAIVHPAVCHLALWHKVGVAHRPTADLAMEWLANLDSGRTLSADELRRVRSLLPRYPERIWSDCGHWLNLDAEWTPTDQLVYSLTMQALVPWKHLFRPTKQRTADLQKLSAEVCQQQPFSELRSLAASIENRFHERLSGLPEPQPKPWLNALGAALRRIVLEGDEETFRVRELGNRLASTNWQIACNMETAPYIDGAPAGTPRRIDVLWEGSLLYVENRSAARMAKSVAHELGRVFNRSEIADAIKMCYDRLPEFVAEYLEENFTLAPEEEVASSDREHSPDHVTKSEHAVADDAEMAQPEAGNDNALASEPTGQEAKTESAPDPVSVPEGGFDADLLEASQDGDLDGELPEPATTRPKDTKPPKPSLMERFAKLNGYVKDGDGRFYHSDGSWIEKVGVGHSFPWERRSVSGELIECYWLKEHCLQREPLPLDVDVWKLCDESPDKYTLLLVDGDDAPLQITGRQLREMRDAGELTLYPAKYRLVYGH